MHPWGIIQSRGCCCGFSWKPREKFTQHRHSLKKRGEFMTEARKFRCASCGYVFEESTASTSKCPHCRERVLILLEGERTRKKQQSGSCSSG